MSTRRRFDLGTWSSAVLVVAFGVLVWRWTEGLTTWTFEDRRRLLASRGELVAPPLAITDDIGIARTLWSKDDRRAVSLVSFVYTRCASVCSALGAEDLLIQRELEQGPPTSIRLVTLSFDTPRDDSRSLHRYATRFQADRRWWTVAAPTDPRAGADLREALGVVAVPDAFGGYVHNGDIHLVDADGRLRGIFDFANWPQALRAARRLDAETRGNGAA
jgi:protein SCO1/2